MPGPTRMELLGEMGKEEKLPHLDPTLDEKEMNSTLRFYHFMTGGREGRDAKTRVSLI